MCNQFANHKESMWKQFPAINISKLFAISFPCKTNVKLANIARRTLLFVSESLTIDKKLTTDENNMNEDGNNSVWQTVLASFPRPQFSGRHVALTMA